MWFSVFLIVVVVDGNVFVFCLINKEVCSFGLQFVYHCGLDGWNF